MKTIAGYDITHEKSAKDGFRIAEIEHDDEDNSYSCTAFDYVLTEDEFKNGIKEGWIRVEE